MITDQVKPQVTNDMIVHMAATRIKRAKLG